MPLIRIEIWSYVRLWNVHSIQNQKKRPDGVYGKPFFLYHYPEDCGVEDYGILPDKNLLEGLLNGMGDWGMTSHTFLLI
jgi:hypothetical protein